MRPANREAERMEGSLSRVADPRQRRYSGLHPRWRRDNRSPSSAETSHRRARPPCLHAPAGPKGSMLHGNDITYRIGDRLIFDQASFALPPGGKIGLVGRNGAGKTTLFRIVLGEVGT